MDTGRRPSACCICPSGVTSSSTAENVHAAGRRHTERVPVPSQVAEHRKVDLRPFTLYYTAIQRHALYTIQLNRAIQYTCYTSDGLSVVQAARFSIYLSIYVSACAMSETPTRTTFRPRRPRANSVKLVSLLQRPPRSASVGSGAQKWPGAVMNDQKPVVHHTVHGTYGTPRGWYAYGVRTVAQQLPCASGTYATQEAGTYLTEPPGRTCQLSQKPLWFATASASERPISPHGGQEQSVSDAAIDMVDFSW